jgi:WASH complex subunit strumpellin
MGRVMAAVLKMTDPKTLVFAPECPGWYQAQDGNEVCGISTFSLLNRAIGVIGLGGLDRLLGFRIVYELGQFVAFYKAQVKDQAPFMEQLQGRLFPTWSLPENAAKLYEKGRSQLERFMAVTLGFVQRIGQAQLLRKQIAKELLFGCRMDANLYHQVRINLH